VKPIAYSVPWDQVYSLTPHIARGTRRNVDEFSAAIVRRMDPPPVFEGLDLLPDNPRFLLVANHYQRKGLWILHSAAALTQGLRRRYGPGDPPIRWLVTANWPALHIGSLRLPSPGDWLLPRVAHALHCYPVTFAGRDPRFTARILRRLLQDARTADRPIGLFPEGVGGSAGVLTAPLPGVDRLILQLARIGLPAVPAGISEAGRLVLRFGAPIPAADLLSARDAAAVCMARVAALLEVA
jgi:hypothetical protein